jgi:hypothetical protein
MNNQQKQNLKMSFYIIALMMFIISFVTIYKTTKSVGHISDTLELRIDTVSKLEELYSELEPLMAVKQQLLDESDKRDVSDAETLLGELKVEGYNVTEDNQVDREGCSFITQTVTVKNMELNSLKELMDTFIHEWPYINIQRVQIQATEDGRADLMIKLIFTEVL